MMFQPNSRRSNPATIFPSWKRVTKPNSQEVTGMMAKMMLMSLPIPK